MPPLEENARIRCPVTNLALDQRILQKGCEKGLKLACRGDRIRWIREHFAVVVQQSVSARDVALLPSEYAGTGGKSERRSEETLLLN